MFVMVPCVIDLSVIGLEDVVKMNDIGCFPKIAARESLDLKH